MKTVEQILYRITITHKFSHIDFTKLTRYEIINIALDEEISCVNNFNEAIKRNASNYCYDGPCIYHDSNARLIEMKKALEDERAVIVKLLEEISQCKIEHSL